MTEGCLSDLLLETKDGDWGREVPVAGDLPYRVIRGADFPTARNGHTSTIPLRYLKPASATRRTLQPNDILIETAGGNRGRPTGRTLLITERLLNSLDAPASCASFCRFLRVDPDKADPAYVFWYLQNMYEQGAMWEHQVQHTGVARFQFTQFAKSVPIALPNRPVQEAISRFLGALDEKIEHNQATSSRLAETASVYFKRQSRGWANTGHHGVLGQLGGPIAERVTDTGLPYIGLDAMPQGIPVLSEWTTDGGPSGQSSRYVRGDILFGKLRPYFKKVGVAPIDGRCSTEILVLRPADDRNWGPLLGYVLSHKFIAHCVANSTGTKMPRSEWRNINDFPVTIPSPRDAARCTEFMRSTFNLVNAFVHESHSLAAIRDALLPKLVSGRIRVPESCDPDDPLGAAVKLAAAS